MLDNLPDSLVLHILKYLEPEEISRVGQCSKKCRRIAFDEILWRNLFYSYFKLDPRKFPNPIGKDTWREEFIRLTDETPLLQTEVINVHTDQVLHVSFSHDGNRFATSSKDGYVNVWKMKYPVELEFTKNMQEFNWKYTQYSQFNESETLLLVSGVLFGGFSTSGEIAVLDLQDFSLKCRVSNKPYDIFGCWYSDQFLLSGDLQWLGHAFVSRSTIWLNRASQMIESEHTAVINRMYKFYNPRASSVRSIMVVNCVQESDDTQSEVEQNEQEQLEETEEIIVLNNNNDSEVFVDNDDSNMNEATIDDKATTSKSVMTFDDDGHTSKSETIMDSTTESTTKTSNHNFTCDNNNESKNKPENTAFVNNNDNDDDDVCESLVVENNEHDSMDDTCGGGEKSDNMDQNERQSPSSSTTTTTTNTYSESPYLFSENSNDEVIDPREKYLIFTCGNLTYTPHCLGFVKIKPVQFRGEVNPGLSIEERRAVLRRRRLEEESGIIEELDYTDYPRVAHLFDKIDTVIDLEGHIIGLAISPDHRFLYVNSRPWPKGYDILDPLNPPPIAQEIDIHVFDMTTLKKVGITHTSHRAFTPNEECFFIFLDVGHFYLASGSEDKHAYTWERHYNVPLAKLPHTDVVNSVAFNPKNDETLISVSDDNSIKIWRSQAQCRKLNISNCKSGTKLYRNNNKSQSSTKLL